MFTTLFVAKGGFRNKILAVLAGLWCLASLDSSAALFSGTNLIRISIEIPPSGMDELRFANRRSRPDMTRTKVLARVVEGGNVYTNVLVHLKGAGSFRPIDHFPSLTLNFDNQAPDQKFHGLTKISLNNSVQDPTCMNEKVSRELFAAAGVPVARSDYAVVTLNNRKLGLYLLMEGYDKKFLKRHFKDNDGDLYDGGLLTDIDRPLEVISGENKGKLSSLKRLRSAIDIVEPEKRYAALEKIIDLDRFFSMTAMETILCHWDSYSINRSNYRIYHDPKSDRLVFMPHGMDRVLGGFLPNLDLPVVPPMQGMAARALISTPEGRKRHVDQVKLLASRVFSPTTISNRIKAIDARIADEIPDPSARWAVLLNNPDWDFVSSGDHRKDIDDLCVRVQQRASFLKEQLRGSNSFPMTPFFVFDTNGVCHLEQWRTAGANGNPAVTAEVKEMDSQQVIHLTVPAGAIGGSVRQKGRLEPGRYRLTARAKLEGQSQDGIPPIPSSIILHHSGNRFGTVRQYEGWGTLSYDFYVAPGAAAEEVDLICGLRGSPAEARIQVDTFQLRKLSPTTWQ